MYVDVLGVAGLGSHKILEVFLSHLPEVVCWCHHLVHLLWRNQPKHLCVGLTQDGFFYQGEGFGDFGPLCPFVLLNIFAFSSIRGCKANTELCVQML